MRRRWNSKQEDQPLNESYRSKQRFLWFPRSIDGEVRWLEVAAWQEESQIGGLLEPSLWVAIAWEEVE